MSKSVAKRGVISDSQLFCILFTVRLYSLLLSSFSAFDTAVYFVITAVLSLLAYLFKNALSNKAACVITGALCFLLMLQTVNTYIVFISSAVHPHFSTALLAVLIFASVIYAAYLKIEPLARFSAFCAAVLFITVFVGGVTNLKTADCGNITSYRFYNGLSFYNCVKCLDLPLIFLMLNKRINNRSKRALALGVLAPYAVTSAAFFAVVSVTGTAVNEYAYPFFSFFQLSKIGTFSRLDIVFTGSMILALFIKCSVLLYCAVTGIFGDKNEKA